MFSSRLLGAAQALSLPLQFVTTPSALPDQLTPNCRLVLVDLSLASLDLPAAIAAVRASSPQARIVAFGAHVNEALLDAARQAGCDEVLSRGQFHRQYVDLLRDAAAA